MMGEMADYNLETADNDEYEPEELDRYGEPFADPPPLTQQKDEQQ